MKIAGKVPAADLAHISLGQDGGGALLATHGCAIADPILCVLGRGSVTEIRQTVIAHPTRAMPHLLAGWRWPDECPHHQAVHGESFMCPVARQRNGQVSLWPTRRAQDALLVNSSTAITAAKTFYAATITDLVEALVADYRKPALGCTVMQCVAPLTQVWSTAPGTGDSASRGLLEYLSETSGWFGER